MCKSKCQNTSSNSPVKKVKSRSATVNENEREKLLNNLYFCKIKYLELANTIPSVE